MHRMNRLAILIAALVALVAYSNHDALAQDAGDEPNDGDSDVTGYVDNNDGVTGWADEGDGNTIMCIEVFKLLLDSGGSTITDGEIASGTLAVNPKYANFAGVMLQRALLLTGQGVTTSVDAATRRVLLRTDGGAARSDNGELMDLTLVLKGSIDAIASELPPMCKDILIKRLVVSSGAGGGVGDPHLTTLDQVSYDFQEAGVFRLFQSGNLLVQVFQHKCTPTLHLGNARSPSCYQGVAVSFAGSVVKFFIANNRIEIGRGGSDAAAKDLAWLSVHKANGRTDGYRVLTAVDEATYVDIMLTRWVNDYPLLNVALRVSPYFKTAYVDGLLGNWNGVKSDDSKNSAALAKRHGFALDDNLFTCTGDACDHFRSPPTAKDWNATRVPSQMTLLRQGFTPVDVDIISVRSFTPAVLAAATPMHHRRERRAQFSATSINNIGNNDDNDDIDDVIEASKQVEMRAHALCPLVFAQLTVCSPYVTNTTNFINVICIGDTVLVGDLSIIDTTKVAYLRECRRELDARIEANTTSAAETTQLLADRTALAFGNVHACPNNCSGRGSCLAAACKCDTGVTGIACDIVV